VTALDERIHTVTDAPSQQSVVADASQGCRASSGADFEIRGMADWESCSRPSRAPSPAGEGATLEAETALLLFHQRSDAARVTA
jgi:hypothetical protein